MEWKKGLKRSNSIYREDVTNQLRGWEGSKGEEKVLGLLVFVLEIYKRGGRIRGEKVLVVIRLIDG